MLKRLLAVTAAVATVALPAPTAAAEKLPGAPVGGRLLTAALSGAEEVPGPGDPTAGGSFIGTFNADEELICYELRYQGTPAIAAHIHRGAAGVAGPVVVTLQAPSTGFAKDCAAAGGGLIAEIGSDPDGFYVNVHSVPFPNGSGRGQLSR